MEVQSNHIQSSDARVSQFLNNILGILSSEKPDVVVSSELLDLLGLDYIELTSKIMQQRFALGDLVSAC
jgi:hypothetical protein